MVTVPQARRLGGVLLFALVCAAPVQAAPGWFDLPSQPQPQNLVSPPGVSLEQAAETVRRETGGRVLSASPAERSGIRGYDVRVLLEGKRVRNVFVDHEGRIDRSRN